MSARYTALAALIACRKQGAWSDGALKSYILRDRLDRRDAALASRLCYGVLQNRMLLDHYLGQLVKGKLSDLQPVVLDILRIGAYQLLFLDRIPVSAAVNEAVECCKKSANSRAAGLVNGVLRNLDRSRAQLRKPETLSVRYSHPEELVQLLREQTGGEKLKQILAADNTVPDIAVQADPLRVSGEELLAELREQGCDAQPHPWLKDCVLISGAGNVEALPAFREGHFYVQDPAAKLAADAAAVRPGMRVLDACAAPGGKTAAMALAMGNEGEVTACDLHPHKLTLIDKNCARLGIACVRTMVQDASAYREDWQNAFDAVLTDVPCSGLGVIRKKPDIRYKDLKPLAALPALQLRILANNSRYVKPGGRLVYATCTVLRRENEDVVRAFLDSHPEFETVPCTDPSSGRPADMVTLLPGDCGTDGFFYCCMRKTR